MSLSAILYTSSACVHCPTMKQTLTELKIEFGDNLNLVILEVDTNPKHMQSAREWEIQGVPTVVLIKDRVEIGRISGSLPKVEVEKLFERYIQRDVLQEQPAREPDSSSTLLCDPSGETNSKS